MDKRISEGDVRERLTCMFSDQPSFDWKLGLWTGRALVSPFHSRSSIILPATLSNSFWNRIESTYIKTVSRATARDTARDFPT